MGGGGEGGAEGWGGAEWGGGGGGGGEAYLDSALWALSSRNEHKPSGTKHPIISGVFLSGGGGRGGDLDSAIYISNFVYIYT